MNHRGRPIKYNTEEERIEAKRNSKREYMRRYRANNEHKKRGRPIKYTTDEERCEARKLQKQNYYNRRKISKLDANDSSEYSED